MIITKTPFQMSFFGGGTDMEDYFKKMVVQFFSPHSINIAMLTSAISLDFLITQQSCRTPKQSE